MLTRIASIFVGPAVIALPMAAQTRNATVQIPGATGGVSVKLSRPSDDPDGYRKIEFTQRGTVSPVIPRNPVSCIPVRAKDRLETGLPDKIAGTQLDPSRCFFQAQYTVGGHPHLLLFFVGEGFASGAAPAVVIGFRDGRPYKVFERDEFDITSFETGRGTTARIVGKPTLSEEISGPGDSGGPYATTYDPFAVYEVSEDSSATYSLTESREYNQVHYVWAGPHSREDYSVVYNLPGRPKPFGIRADRARKLLSDRGPRNQ